VIGSFFILIYFLYVFIIFSSEHGNELGSIQGKKFHDQLSKHQPPKKEMNSSSRLWCCV